ncbi:TlpA disulfide reductase family protein [Qingshengfaniella alkalisoli]|uniref:TlpA family protein disulfide reductase n=1 Tax=Qingshengfaniella alkalisoli TaxID=2599296 RepID=A0A5B8J2V3_9RHOB|nr:TlpA disulfide reductase family protein [Qingshengfaniella alkalisoli]QDY68590.1 TlpA family protein disulfide reductase [Qingshengfaniella alkalisoli]
MRPILALLAFTAAFASAATAQDIPALEGLRKGDMKKLVFHNEAKDSSNAKFVTMQDDPASLEDFRGKYVLLNFWATWCAPCRTEMPMLDELEAEFGGDDFEVVALATGPNAPAAIRRFVEDEGLENLTIYRDPKQKVAREMAVLGLPITVLLDPDGNEIARMQGDAEWNGESAKAIIAAMLGGA